MAKSNFHICSDAQCNTVVNSCLAFCKICQKVVTLCEKGTFVQVASIDRGLWRRKDSLRKSEDGFSANIIHCIALYTNACRYLCYFIEIQKFLCNHNFCQMQHQYFWNWHMSEIFKPRFAQLQKQCGSKAETTWRIYGKGVQSGKIYKSGSNVLQLGEYLFECGNHFERRILAKFRMASFHAVMVLTIL